MLLVVGLKRSGKGTLARVLKALVGEDNVAGPTLSSLATSFGLWPLLGKTVAVVSDARLSGPPSLPSGCCRSRARTR
jgi:putative DNA primase/helicase